jgi:hypothetical protein
MEEVRNAFNILTGKLTGKISIGRLNHKREDNIRTDLIKAGVDKRFSLIWLRIEVHLRVQLEPTLYIAME